MKKEQMLYVGLGLLIVFAFMLVSVNTRSYNNSFRGFSFGNSFDNALVNSAAPVNNTFPKQREGFLASAPVNPPTGDWRIEDYLDNPRGASCAGNSFGITAAGGSMCLTDAQSRAMASRGFNTDDSGCRTA